MKKIVPNFVCDDDGNKAGVIFPKKEFDKVIELLEDYDDYRIVRKRTAKPFKTYSAEEAWAMIEKRK